MEALSPKTLIPKLSAEFVGTFFLVFTIGCNVLSGQSVWAGVSIACVLTVMIYALGGASGANFNPAVSLALGLTKDLPWPLVGCYAVTQLLAGVVARICYTIMFGGKSIVLQPTEGHLLWQAGLAELLYTFMLCFVVLNTACSKEHAGKDQFYGIAIGFVIVAGAYSGGSISMGCFNPAVAIGLEGSTGLMAPFYWACELVGAALAAVLYKVVRPDQEPKPDRLLPSLVKEPAPLLPRVVSEFLGTFFLVLTVGLNVLSGSPAGAFSIAASLMSMIFALGSVSGAHFNPAVTVAIMCSGRDCISLKDGGIYIAVQIVAGIAAAFTYAALMNGKTFGLRPDGSTWPQICIAEFVYTFLLAFVVLSVATIKKVPHGSDGSIPPVLSQYFGFAIGMCVTVGGCAIGKISGGSLNPAVSVGIAGSHILNGGMGVPCLPYVLVEIAAGAFAAGVFKVTQPSEYIDTKTPRSLSPKSLK